MKATLDNLIKPICFMVVQTSNVSSIKCIVKIFHKIFVNLYNLFDTMIEKLKKFKNLLLS